MRRGRGNRAVRRENRRRAAQRQSAARRTSQPSPHERWKLEGQVLDEAAEKVADDPRLRARVARARKAHRSRRP